MSDNAEIVREALADPDCPTVKITAALAALDEMEARWQYAQQTRAEAMALWKAVEAERDEARRRLGDENAWCDLERDCAECKARAEKAEAEVKRLRETLSEIECTIEEADYTVLGASAAVRIARAALKEQP